MLGPSRDRTVLERLGRMRWVVPFLSVALLATLLTVVAASAPAEAASPTVTVTLSGGSILAGDNGTLSVSAANTGATDGFNLAFFLDVPVGLVFVSSDLGTPTIYDAGNQPTVPLAAGMQRWVWEDIEDLPAGGRKGGSITVSAVQPAFGSGETPDTTVSPVGSAVTVAAHSALSGDPTYLPVFNGSTGVGGALAIAATGISTTASVTVSIVSLRVSASEPSPEDELLRGVVNQATTRTLTVHATSEGDTTGATLVDYLPAGLEFLGCGTLDNSTVDRDVTDPPVNEYDGASPLDATSNVASSCLTPSTIDTIVADSTLATTLGLVQGAVYTRVAWDLGTVAHGDTVTVKYAAGVPLQENTMTWDGPTPSPASLQQNANLDNNNGPSTRHGDVTPVDGRVWTSVATVNGSYQGVVRTGTDRADGDRASVSVYAMDLSVIKSVDGADSHFVVGNVADFTLHLQESTYMSSTDIVLTDEIPNGLCPLLPVGVTLTLDPGASVPGSCEAVGTVTGGDMISATAHTDGTFTVVLRPTDGGTPDAFVLGPDATHDINYQALNRGSYVTASQYGSTTSGDGFRNTVSFTATTHAIIAIAGTYPDPLKVWDDSSATIQSDLTTISKRVLERADVTKDLAPGADPCTTGTFVDTPVTNFRLGDTVCFELRVNFPGSIDTRNPVVTDFLPDGLTYAGWAVAAGSTAPVDSTVVDNSGTTAGSVVWELGTLGAGGDLYVPLGDVFIAHVWATVDLPSNGLVLDKPENLMKYRQQNVQGELYFLRTQAAVTVDPELELTKGVESVTGGNVFMSNIDHVLVREGEVVTFRVDLHGLPYDASQAEVWDLLPAGVTKADVSAVSDGGVVYDPSDGGYPAGMAPGNQTRSVVVWTGLAVPGGQKALAYDVTIPVGTGVTSVLTNTASIIEYHASVDASTNPNAQVYTPANSLDTDRWAEANTDGANTMDDSDVYLPSPTVGKTATSPAATNNLDSQVVKGEVAEFDYTVTVPAHTTVHDATLSDVIANASNWTTVPGSTTVTYPGPATTSAGDASFDLGGQTFSVNTATGLLTFPATYSNATGADQAFTVHLEGYIKSTSSWTHNVATARGDTATFSSTDGADVTAGANVKLIEPSPTLTKVADDTTVTASQTVTYTMTATNAAGRPTLFDGTVTDCVPVELANVTVTSPASGWTVTPSSCGTGSTGTLLTWSVGDVVAGTPAALTYTVVASPASAGGAQYANTGTLTGYSMPAGALDRKAYTASDTETVTVVSATFGKAVDQPTATIGQERSFTLTGTIPADVNFYDAIVVDDVPAGMSISGVTVTCLDSLGGSCNADLPGAGSALTPSGTLQGWWLGDITSGPLVRTVTITYTGTVLDVVGNARPGALTNSARLRWNIVNTETTAPTASYIGTAATSAGNATVTITEPSLGVNKLVNGAAAATVNPGTSFSYSVAVSNSGTSAAYDVTVTDVVPVGVVVTGGTISNGGVLTGNGANGGGTITWTLASVAASATTTLTYSATFASSLTLADGALTNTASVDQYFSHPTLTAGFDDGALRRYTGPTDTAAVTPGFPTLTVTKTATSGATAYINQAHIFTVAVKNTGNGPANGIVASDVLPAGWSYIAGTTTVNGSGVADPAIVGQTLTWSGLPNRNANATDTIIYQAKPLTAYAWNNTNTGASVNHTNTVTATANDTSGAPRNLSRIFTASGAATVHINDADLDITKTHATTVVAGSNTVWTVTVHNGGPDAAVGNIVVTDQLPASASLVGISGAGWVAGTPNGSNVVTFTRAATLNSTQSSTFTVTLSFPASAAAGISADNTACVAAKTFDSQLSDNCVTDTDTVITRADLSLDKIAGAAAYVAGDPMSWTLNVTNNGPSDSQAPFSVTDSLPAAIDWNTATASGTGWTCGAVDTGTGHVTCTRATGTLTPGSSLPAITVTGTVDSGFAATLTNTATVTGTTTEPASPGLTNNTDTTNTIADTASADLSLVKTLSSADVVAGGQGRYLIDVANDGPSDATTVLVVDHLPVGLTYAGGLTSAPGDTWSCAPDGSVVGKVNCTLDSNAGTLTAGSHTWFSFNVNVASSVKGSVTNSATVSSDADDPDTSNNTDTTSDGSLVETNVSIAKTHPGGPTYLVGDEVPFTMTVTNDGLADAATVVVTDTLPAGVAFARTELDTGWTVSGPDVDGILTMTLDDPLASGATASLVVVGTLGDASFPSATNVADVTTTTTETTLADNGANDTVTVSSPDLEIVKTADVSVAQGGDTFTFTLAVSNVDPDAGANAVTVTDTLPYDLKVTTDPADIGGVPWDCALTGTDGDGYGGVLVCELATLAAGADATDIAYDVEVAAAVARDQITNTASVASDDEHPDLVDVLNVDSATVDIKWIDFSGDSVCVNDVPWFQYAIDAHNVANGLPITLTWYPDSDSNGVADGPAIDTQTLGAVTDGSPLADEVLWPGAAADGDGIGIAWPGWRTVTTGETPGWENQILDPALPEYALRAGALVTVSINPESSVSTAYPLTTPTCEAVRDVAYDVDLTASGSQFHRGDTFTYTLQVAEIDYGASNDVVLSTPIPPDLMVLDVTPVPSTDPTIPDWLPCTVTGQDTGGYGGTVECILDGWLGYGQQAPDVVITARFSQTASLGALPNLATVTWTDPDVVGGSPENATDPEVITLVLSAAELLAMTGLTSASALWWAAGFVALGSVLLAVVRRRHQWD